MLFVIRILVVEDEIGLADAVGAILRMEGYSADVANDGRTGLELALKNEYDCIILDIMLPGMNGLDVLKEIKSDPKLKDIAVIMVSAYTSAEDIEQSMNLGASGFIKKPVIMDILLSNVTAELDKI